MSRSLQAGKHPAQAMAHSPVTWLWVLFYIYKKKITPPLEEERRK